MSCAGKLVADHANIKATGGTTQATGSVSIGIVTPNDASFTDSVIAISGGEIKGEGSVSHGAFIFADDGSVSFTRCTFVSVIGYGSAFGIPDESTTKFLIDNLQSLEGSSTIENPSFGAVNDSNLYTLKYIRSVVAEPTLEIISPTDGSTVSSNTVEITGTTNCTSVTITVNGTDVGEVEVTGGSFSKTVTLSQGKNTITVTATNIGGQSLTEEIEVTYGASQSSDTNPVFLIVVVLVILAVACIAVAPRKN